MESALSRRQLLALGTVSFLAPALRFYPSESVALSGRAAWTAALAALPLMLGYCWFLTRLLALRREGEGLCELIARAAPGRAGRSFGAPATRWGECVKPGRRLYKDKEAHEIGYE